MTREFKPPTEAQKTARWRNWRIRCLRALWAQCSMLTGEREVAAKAAINAELEMMGAKPSPLETP